MIGNLLAISGEVGDGLSFKTQFLWVIWGMVYD